MRIDAAIIGGTGIGSRLMRLEGRVLHVPTREGMIRGKVLDHDGVQVLVLSRHSAGHKVPPHRVAYEALALGVRALGAKACFSTAAVGSLRPDWAPGTMAACRDFLDLSARNTTLFDREVVHRDFSSPFPARQWLLQGASDAGIEVHDEGVYLCGNGPRYETPHEITLYRQFGADVVGMTASSEAIAFGEAEVPYACLAVVTNLAAGISEQELSHEEVVEEMERSGTRAVEVLLAAVRRVSA